MPEFLKYVFNDDEEFINTFDELPLWSAPFGLLLLKHLHLKDGIKVLDLGPGTGFPILELAQRSGEGSTFVGLDPWINANIRARQKIRNYGIRNVEIIDGDAEQMPFEDEMFDLIVSNLGINNFNDPPAVLNECNRVLKQGGRLAITTNLDGHWKEFYEVFEDTLLQAGQHGLVKNLTEHQAHRGTAGTVSQLFNANGFTIIKQEEEKFEMLFLNGSAFLNHHFVKLGWLASWKELIPEPLHEKIFTLLEKNLNSYAEKEGELKLTVPMLYLEGEKIS